MQMLRWMYVLTRNESKEKTVGVFNTGDNRAYVDARMDVRKDTVRNECTRET